MGGRTITRSLVWLAFAGQVAFVVSWIVAGALEPGYSHAAQGVSQLAARSAAHPWIVVVGLSALGVSFFLLGVALWRVLSRRRALVLLAFALAGAALVVSALIRLDCEFSDHHCRALWDAGRLSWHQEGHLWAGLASQLALGLTPFALARALWPGTAGAAALSAGAVGVAIGVVSFFGFGLDGAGGLVQRADLFVLHVWSLIVGVGVLWATRRADPPGELIPVRPRDFFATSWRGSGELVLRPLWLGRLFAQRFEAHRDSAWISERVWRIDDSAHFPGDRVERRQTYCEFVADDHVRLTAGDLPDGGDVWIEEGGFRLSPFRVAYPLGPLPVLVRCVDRSLVEPDGTFVNSFDVVALGVPIPLARVTFRVRPVDPEPAGGAARSEPAIGVT
jgi:hypothetical protein